MNFADANLSPTETNSSRLIYFMHENVARKYFRKENSGQNEVFSKLRFSPNVDRVPSFWCETRVELLSLFRQASLAGPPCILHHQH